MEEVGEQCTEALGRRPPFAIRLYNPQAKFQAFIAMLKPGFDMETSPQAPFNIVNLDGTLYHKTEFDEYVNNIDKYIKNVAAEGTKATKTFRRPRSASLTNAQHPLLQSAGIDPTNDTKRVAAEHVKLINDSATVMKATDVQEVVIPSDLLGVKKQFLVQAHRNLKLHQQTQADRTHGLFQPEPEDIHRQAAAACLTHHLFHGHGVNEWKISLKRLQKIMFTKYIIVPFGSIPVTEKAVALYNKLASEYGADKVGEWVATNKLSKPNKKAAKHAKAAAMDFKAWSKARRQRTTRQVDGEVTLKQVEPINEIEQDEDVSSQATFCIDSDTKSRIG